MSSQRLHDLDALRGVAMLLGIVLHSGVFVLPDPYPLWPIHDATASGDPTYKRVIETIHGFRMPVFFLLSGFFSALLWQRRGLRTMALQRLRRIGIPFVIACFTVLPLSIWLLAMASGHQEPYDFPAWALPLVWVSSLGHLWFLWYLLSIVGCFVLAARLGLQFRHRLVWWLVIPASMACSLLMVEPVYGSDNAAAIVPDPVVITYYTCFFVFGAFFHQRKFAVRRWWTVALLPAAAAFGAGLFLLELYLESFGGPVPLGEAASGLEGGVPGAFMFKNPLTLASALIESVCAWLMCLGLMGLFRWIASRESFAVRYVSDASYWMYLMHLPLVIAGQFLVLDWPIHYHLKFLVVCGGVILVLLATYQSCVRYTVIGRMLNGPRTRRRHQSA
jgi:glucan biosynthesis protein C